MKTKTAFFQEENVPITLMGQESQQNFLMNIYKIDQPKISFSTLGQMQLPEQCP
jgi:hypothetical protein